MCVWVCVGAVDLKAGINVPLTGIDSSGNSVSIWETEDSGVHSIQAATLLFGKTWSNPTTISNAGIYSFLPKLEVSSSGVAVAAWVVKDAGIRSLYASILPFGGSWSVPVMLSSTDEYVFDFTVKISHAGDAVATWNAASVSTNDLNVISSASAPFGGSWGTSQTLIMKTSGEQ